MKQVKIIGLATWIIDPDVFLTFFKRLHKKSLTHICSMRALKMSQKINDSFSWNSYDKIWIPHQVQFANVSTALYMWMFLCTYRISISIFAKFQNLLTSGLYCHKKQREKLGWKKACQQVNCALRSHIENGENKIMRDKNDCVYNLFLTNLMLWGAGLWFLSPRKGTYLAFLVEKVCEVLAFSSYRPEKVNSEAESINYLLMWCQFHALCSQPFYKNEFASWKLAWLFFRLPILILCVHFPFTTTVY